MLAPPEPSPFWKSPPWSMNLSDVDLWSGSTLGEQTPTCWSLCERQSLCSEGPAPSSDRCKEDGSSQQSLEPHWQTARSRCGRRTHLRRKKVQKTFPGCGGCQNRFQVEHLQHWCQGRQWDFLGCRLGGRLGSHCCLVWSRAWSILTVKYWPMIVLEVRIMMMTRKRTLGKVAYVICGMGRSIAGLVSFGGGCMPAGGGDIWI